MKTAKKYKVQILLLALVALGVLAYVKRDAIAKLFGGSTTPPPTNNGSGGGAVNTNTHTNTIDRERTLKVGSTGVSVEELQKQLNTFHKTQTPTVMPLLVEDGIFGTKTEAMLEKHTGKKEISLNQLAIDLAAKS